MSDGRLVWIQGRVENISRHLKDCPLAPENEKALGLSECIRLGMIKTDNKFNQSAGVRCTYEQFAADLPSSSTMPNPVHTSPLYPNLQLLSIPSASPSPSPSLLELNNFFPLGTSPNTPSNASPPIVPIPISSPSIGSGLPASKRMCTTSSLSRVASFSQGLEQWTQNEKDEFCRWLACITASCGFPFIWVENPVWRKFCANYIPQAPIISRNTLANQWIPHEVSRYRQQAIEQSKGSLVTIQCDGWTGVNSRHYIGFMVGTDKRQVNITILP
jgi:hypothetical protein